jgi:hypothetical protein
MTNKEKIVVLKQYRMLRLEYKVRRAYHNNIYEKYIELKEKLINPGADAQKLSDMPITHNVSSQIEQNYIKFESLGILLTNIDKEMIDMAENIAMTLNRTRKAIDKVEDSLLRTILILKYIDGMTWEKLAVEIDYTWQHTHELHRKALGQVEI